MYDRTPSRDQRVLRLPSIAFDGTFPSLPFAKMLEMVSGEQAAAAKGSLVSTGTGALLGSSVALQPRLAPNATALDTAQQNVIFLASLMKSSFDVWS
jgi:hypothetical protein